MNPVTKTMLLIFGSIFGIFLIPAILIICHEYVNAFFAIFFFLASFFVFGYYSYIEFYPIYLKQQREEDDIFHQFHGDKEKIRFYKGFKKYFDGDLSKDGLEQWFEHHPSKKH
jgi:hypothetical protein